jgi:hypothetical protein
MKLLALEIARLDIYHGWRDGLCYRRWPGRLVVLLEIEPLLFGQVGMVS